MTQNLRDFEAVSLVEKENTRVYARILFPVGTPICIVTHYGQRDRKAVLLNVGCRLTMSCTFCIASVPLFANCTVYNKTI